MKRFAALFTTLAFVGSLSAQQIGIGTSITSTSGIRASFDQISAASPTIYLKAQSGYFTDGCIRIGDVPGVGAVTNYLSSAATGLRCGSLGWSGTCVFCIDTDTGADQTIASKAAAANYEWQLTAIRQSATTFLLRLTCYNAAGNSSITATSLATITLGTTYQVSFAYDTSDCHISVNNETPVVSTSTLTMASGTADFRIGSYQISDQHFNGRIDAFGFSVASQYCLAQRSQFYNSGSFKNYADITGVKTLTAWWDFGNATLYDQVDADPNNWESKYDWLMDSVGEGTTSTYTLTQATAGSDYPYVTKGLVTTAATADLTTGALGYNDSSGNSNHAVQPFHFSRPGFKTVSGRQWFYFDGTVPLSATAYNARWMPVPLKTADQTTMTGTNKSWSMCALVKSINVLSPSSTGSPAAPLIAQTVAGICRMGRPPWRLIGTAESTAPGIHAVRYHILPTAAESPYVPYSSAGVTRWAIDREADSGRLHIGFDTYAGRFDTSIHAVVLTYDGSTQIATLYIDGTAVLTTTQTNDNATSAGALGTQTIKYFVAGESLHGDNFNRGFPPIEYGAGGKGFYGYQDRIAFWAGTALTPTQVGTITDDLLGTTTHPLAGALAAPTTTSGLTLLHWLDAAYGQNFVQKSSPTSYAVADGDKVGSWRSRKGTATFVASTDAKRPALKLSIQNSLPVVRSDGNTNSQLLSYSSALSQPYTLFFVAARQTGSAEGYFWGHDSGAGYFGFSNSTTANLYMGATISGTAATQTTMSLWKVRVNGASSSIIRDGATVASGSAGTDALTVMRLFGIQDTGSLYYLPADMAEFRIYTGTDAGGEEAAITAEMKAKWATPFWLDPCGDSDGLEWAAKPMSALDWAESFQLAN